MTGTLLFLDKVITNSIKIKDKKNLNKKTQYIFFKAKDKKVLEKLQTLDFDKLSKNNTTTPGFGKADVIAAYLNLDDNRR